MKLKVYEIENESGEVFAFEIGNTFLSRKKVIAMIEKMPGATVIHKPKGFSLDDQDEFCELEYEGKNFIIEEPWGDSNRYWIGPKPIEYNPNISSIIKYFLQQ